MAKKINRRTFIKKSTAIGVGSLIGTAIIPGLEAKAKNPIDISIVTGKNYFENTIKAVDELGGIKKFVSKKSKVGILINSPFKNPGTIVNPTIPLAVIKMCFDAGVQDVCCIPDVPEGYWDRSPEAEQMQEQIKLVKPAGSHQEVNIPGGKSLKKANVAKGLLDCDVFIDIPIVKDHAGTRFTCTLKNLMGACPYSTNRFFHFGSNAKKAYDDVEFLSQCIADLNLVKKPSLCVVDATAFITTNGPFGPGDMKKLHKVVAGTNNVLVDSYCSTLLGLKPEDVVMIKKAHEHGLGSMDLKKAVIKEIAG